MFRSCLLPAKLLRVSLISSLSQHCPGPVPIMKDNADATTGEQAPLADSAYTFKEAAKRVSEQPDLLKGWRGESEDVTKDEQPWAAYGDQQPVLGLQHEAKLGLFHNINNVISVPVRKCNASCQTPPEFFPEVHNAHLCSCDHHSDPAALAASHFSRECCPALEDVNQQFQLWLHEAHQMQALHPDPFVLFPQHAFRFWPYPGWIPRDDSPG